MVSKYAQGYKYCRLCEIWSKSDKVFCTDCKRRFRTGPVQAKYREKIVKDIKRIRQVRESIKHNKQE